MCSFGQYIEGSHVQEGQRPVMAARHWETVSWSMCDNMLAAISLFAGSARHAIQYTYVKPHHMGDNALRVDSQFPGPASGTAIGNVFSVCTKVW